MPSAVKKAFVAGYPVKHSRSPLIHGTWLRVYGLDGAYERVEVAPGDLPAFLGGFPEQGYAGGNVTVPHKEAAFRLADVATERARRVEAANTLWIEDGRLHADNTDVFGFLANLDQALGTGWAQDVRRALVLGAGGAARAVVVALLDRGLDVVVANRTLARAEELKPLGPGQIRAIAWDAIPDLLPRVGLVVNATSLGMAGQPPLLIDLQALPDGAVATDIVYVPMETAFLAAARRRGLRVVDGLGMLLHQATPGFERWFGVRPEVTPALRDLVVADIEGRAKGSPEGG